MYGMVIYGNRVGFSSKFLGLCCYNNINGENCFSAANITEEMVRLANLETEEAIISIYDLLEWDD